MRVQLVVYPMRGNAGKQCTVYWESFVEIKFHEFREVDSIRETLIREC